MRCKARVSQRCASSCWPRLACRTPKLLYASSMSGRALTSALRQTIALSVWFWCAITTHCNSSKLGSGSGFCSWRAISRLASSRRPACMRLRISVSPRATVLGDAPVLGLVPAVCGLATPKSGHSSAQLKNKKKRCLKKCLRDQLNSLADSSKRSNVMPQPLATQVKGSCATITGNPASSARS